MGIKIHRVRRAGSPHTKNPRRVIASTGMELTRQATGRKSTKKTKSRKGNPHLVTEEERIRKMMADGRKQLAKLKAKGILKKKPKPRKPKKPMKSK
tara:strand:+ start:802 stop:1089 length:288 start_codon:yes stop_codon:yes gene_type:complete